MRKTQICFGVFLLVMFLIPSGISMITSENSTGKACSPRAADDAPAAAFWIRCNQASETAIEALTETTFEVTNTSTTGIAFGSNWDLFPGANDTINATSTTYINMLFDKDQYTIHFRITMYSLSISPYAGNIIGHYQNDNSTFVWKLIQTDNTTLTMTVENGGTDPTKTFTYANNTSYDMMITVNETTHDIQWFVDGANYSTGATGLIAGNLTPDDNSQLILGDFSATANITSKVRFTSFGYNTVYSDDETTETASFFSTMDDTTGWTCDNTSTALVEDLGNEIRLNDNVTTSKASLYRTLNDSDYTLYMRCRVLSNATVTTHVVNATSTPFIAKHEVTAGQDKNLWSIRVVNETAFRFSADANGTDSTTDLSGNVYNQASAYGWYNFKIVVSSAVDLESGHLTTVEFYYGTSTGTWTSIANKTTHLVVNYDSRLTLGSDETTADILCVDFAWVSLGLTDTVTITISDDKASHVVPNTVVTFTITCTYTRDGISVGETTSQMNYLAGAVVTATVNIDGYNSADVSIPSLDNDVDLTDGTGTFTENGLGIPEATYTFKDIAMLDDACGWLTTSMSDHTQQWWSPTGGGPGADQTEDEEDGFINFDIPGVDATASIPLSFTLLLVAFGLVFDYKKRGKSSLLSRILRTKIK